MLTVLCEAPGKLVSEQRPRPLRQPGEVLLRVRRVGVCGTDLHIFTGNQPYLAYPRVMGHELSGVVEEADPESGLAPGDAAYVMPYLSCGRCIACRQGKTNCCTSIQVLGVHRDGAMTELLAVPAPFVHKAEGITLDQAAMLEFLAIGAHAVRRTEIKPGQRVLIVGSGPIGLGTAYFAKIAGGDVTAIDAAPDKVELTKALGFRTFSVSELESVEFTAIKQTGFDAVLDATGSIRAMNASLFHTRSGGSYTLVGVIKGDLVWPDSEVHRRELTIRGSRNATKADFDHVMDSIRRGLVPTDRLATHATDMDKVIDDLPRWVHARDGLIKAIITV